MAQVITGIGLPSGEGGGNLLIAIRSDNNQPAVFGTFSALEAYTTTQSGIDDAASINVSNASTANTAFVVGTITDNAFDGQPTAYIRVNDEWVLSIAPLVGLPGMDGGAASLADVTIGHVPVKTVNDTFGDSGVEILTNGKVQIPSNTLGLGDLIDLSEATGFALIHNNVTGASFTLLDHFLSDTTGSGRPRQFFIDGSTIEPRSLQSINTEQITTNPLSVNYTTTISGATFSLSLQTFAAMTNVKIRIVDQATGIPFKYAPSKIAWDNADRDGYAFRLGVNTINLFSDDANEPTNGIFNLGFSPIELESGRVLRVEVIADNIAFLGDTNGLPAFSVVAGLGEFRDMAYQSDIGNKDHPVLLRDMPSLEDSLALVNASIDNNSALWLVANNQLPTSNRSDATIYALQAGLLDLDGNEIPTSPVAANTIQLRVGTTVRIFGQNDFRVITTPLLGGDITAATKNKVGALGGDTLAVQPNSSISASFTDPTTTETITLNLDDGNHSWDEIEFVFANNLGTNTVVFNASSEIGFFDTNSNTFVFSPQLTLTGRSARVVFEWYGNDWRIIR